MNKNNKSPYSGAYSRRFSNYGTEISKAVGTNGGASGSVSYSVVVTSSNPDMGSAGLVKLASLSEDVQNPEQVVTNRSMMYPAGTRFRANATPREGYRFKNWTGSLGTLSTPSFEFTLTGSTNLVANFERVAGSTGSTGATTNKTLRVNWNGSMGRVTCSSGSFVYGSESPACSGSITASPETSVKLTAEPNPGYVFVRWDGVNLGGNVNKNTSPSVTINVREATLTAVFAAEENGGSTPSVNVGGGGGGAAPSGEPEPGNVTAQATGVAGKVTAFLKKWWWALLIAAYLYYESREGGLK